MASVDFMKIKTIQYAYNLVKHCDKYARASVDAVHSNPHIDKIESSGNLQGYSSIETMMKIKNKLKELDAKPGANKRKDRVILFGLEIPCPAAIKDRQRFTQLCVDEVVAQYGEGVIVNAYLHQDEIHDYIDAKTGKKRTSLAHVHILCVPVVDGILNGKVFSSPKNMRAINKSIDYQCKLQFGECFMTGEKTKSRFTVEELKLQSHELALNNAREKFEEECKELHFRSVRLDEKAQALEDEKKHIEAIRKQLDANLARSEAMLEQMQQQMHLMTRREYELSERQKREIEEMKKQAAAIPLPVGENYTSNRSSRSNSVTPMTKKRHGTDSDLL